MIFIIILYCQTTVNKGHPKEGQNNGLYGQVVFIWRSFCLIYLVKSYQSMAFKFTWWSIFKGDL